VSEVSAGFKQKLQVVHFRAPSTRIVASMWWFFTLIMVSSYTANLAAFLTTENPTSLVNGIDDLVANKAPYGCKKVGSTINFFKNSEKPPYKDMA
jgi:glutamate receptor, ionotropic, invertebrate